MHLLGEVVRRDLELAGAVLSREAEAPPARRRLEDALDEAIEAAAAGLDLRRRHVARDELVRALVELDDRSGPREAHVACAALAEDLREDRLGGDQRHVDPRERRLHRRLEVQEHVAVPGPEDAPVVERDRQEAVLRLPRRGALRGDLVARGLAEPRPSQHADQIELLAEFAGDRRAIRDELAGRSGHERRHHPAEVLPRGRRPRLQHVVREADDVAHRGARDLRAHDADEAADDGGARAKRVEDGGGPAPERDSAELAHGPRDASCLFRVEVAELRLSRVAHGKTPKRAG